MPQLPADIDRSNRLVFFGNYIEGKGQTYAIQAFACLADQYPTLILEFYAGDMGLDKNIKWRDELVRQVDLLGLSDRVIFNGFTNDIWDELAGALAALNFSDSESFSMTCLEASAIGLPVIATRSGGTSEIIEDVVSGILVPVGDIQAMTNANSYVCENPDLVIAVGYAGRKRAGESFLIEAFRSGLRDMLRLV